MAKSNFRPLHDRVVVRRVESESKTAGGIIIPDTAIRHYGHHRLIIGLTVN
ncbi:hypothetical protein X765_15080 [Mesorhizobium sp. LSHC440B00]|nr:hypothetical protein X765_15080 [Mesorhizobium sp. LSHC440B00]ESX43319.1 hypothetical protein X764_08840 [Mesorhizobium sp. LSHC440A00]